MCELFDLYNFEFCLLLALMAWIVQLWARIRIRLEELYGVEPWKAQTSMNIEEKMKNLPSVILTSIKVWA